jgi:hypothetical protein
MTGDRAGLNGLRKNTTPERKTASEADKTKRSERRLRDGNDDTGRVA